MRDSAWRKALWVALLGLSQALRPLKVKGVKALDRWIIANILVIAAVDLLILVAIGPGAGVPGPVHVLRARAAPGRRPVDPGALRDQKGSGDLFLLWSVEPDLLQHGLSQRASRLRRDSLEQSAKLKKLAPDYYDSLASYRSWTGVLLKFIFDPSMSTYSRVVRAARKREAKRSAARAGRPVGAQDPREQRPARQAPRPDLELIQTGRRRS